MFLMINRLLGKIKIIETFKFAVFLSLNLLQPPTESDIKKNQDLAGLFLSFRNKF
jgi:hypothetical protein